ncbi:hypothetical protein [Bartonella sp. DGB1]|uniref:hypothetical protein n=1 Tax=Bartonella sp. DGB1 TaxID=3239807 RepID=UPI003523C7F8
MELKDFTILKNDDCFSFIKVKDIFFHVQGGGQPHDKLLDSNGELIEIVKDEGNLLLKVKNNMIIDNKIDVFIDSDYRQLCSRLHSAGHLLSLFVFESFKLNTIKAHHFPNEGYIKVEGLIDKDKADYIESGVNAIIDKGCKVISYNKESNKRFVEFCGIGGYECGGTHVSDISEIGKFFIKNISNKKSMTTIKYDIF